ncbi:MAG TPA: acyl carrier protein [Spirochaetota bacterium]|nr:acyl carrier protein [Spirochaetota bacterium]HOM37997.1 acyl carrier protein [Spirochaetota bacterium]HPQ48801.1 acyl carrier protein [Spirochaetota bacterium]
MAVFEKVREIIAENLNLSEDEIKMESNIIDDLGADSLDVMETVMALEEEFDIKFPEEEIKELKTVGDLVKYIEKKIG